jgi:hypothetical protein
MGTHTHTHTHIHTQPVQAKNKKIIKSLHNILTKGVLNYRKLYLVMAVKSYSSQIRGSTTVKILTVFFWVIALCRLVGRYQFCRNLLLPSSALKKEVVCISETLVPTCQTTWSHNQHNYNTEFYP